jgi:hypothetical protein
MTTVAQRIATLLQSVENCARSGNSEWHTRHLGTLAALVKESMPSGGGFDNGTTLDSASTPEKLIFHTSFHHMDESGMYDGWTEHRVTVRASLVFGITLHVSGRDRNDIKDYIAETFHAALTAEVRQ